MNQSCRRLTRLVSLLVVLTGCASAPPVPHLDRPLILLGEVHDNAAQHALRLAAFEALLQRGARPALVMEQFDRAHQADIDALRRNTPSPDADAVIAAAGGGPGWHWPFYRPFVALALTHDLPIVAANVGRTEARAVMRDGLAAHGFRPDVPAPVMEAIAQTIEDGHCGQIGRELARRMALAQVARDQAMALALTSQAERGAVLLAGNGHVRTDIGVPLWLPRTLRARSESIGVLEEGDPTRAYDRRFFTPSQARDDPCAGFGKPP